MEPPQVDETSQQDVDKSGTATVVDDPAAEVLSKMSQKKKYLLLAIFIMAQSIDVAANSMVFPAVPVMANDLHLSGAQSSWLFAAYLSTFAAFLLISGRLSDIYTGKPVFIGGNLILGVFAITLGFVRKKIPWFILRALSGIGASLTIPSALSMAVRVFPDPKEQGFAISMFGLSSGVANIIGILLGGVFTQFASWHWIFWFAGIVVICIAVLSFFAIPNLPRRGQQKNGLDILGVSILIIAMCLFVFALTQGANNGWGQGGVIAPLVLSIAMAVAFFIREWMAKEENAAIPPKMWHYKNFALLFFITVFGPYFWWISNLFLFTSWWQDVLHYSTIDTSVRFLPLGVACLVAAPATQIAMQKFQAKKIFLVLHVMMFIATILLPFADTRDRYWPLIFIAFVIGTMSAMGIYIGASIAFFQTTPPEVAGIVGAIFNSALQIGCALGIACFTSIQTSIDKKSPNKQHGFAGRATAFWFLLGVVTLVGVCSAVFYQTVPGVGVPAAALKDDLEKVVDGKPSDEGKVIEVENGENGGER